MSAEKFKLVLLILINSFWTVSMSYGQSGKEEQHILVSMRMIGHQVLLSSGDSVSRVLPVEKIADSYRIQFESAFEFNPEDLTSVIDRFVLKTKVAKSYIVEVKRCWTDEVVYSYEKGDSINPDLIPCGPRSQPKACYTLFFTILKGYDLKAIYNPAPAESITTENLKQVTTTRISTSTTEKKNNSSPVKKQTSYSMIALPIGSLFVLISLFLYFRKKKSIPVWNDLNNQDLIAIGKSHFDKKNMTLSVGNETIELSGKESDLLFLLYSNENKTLQREYILKVVWGDEGDYIGRTLDVFISKLRKKLEPDSSVKIVNIRGIGYKFIVN
ncbi:MAG: DNA-binding response regulator RprY [Fluviicola sp.]|jgi:DNA-binding winged helix-turn-helix (wHTH) protein|uniref:winged helix-turn-helix domain-containing protein n=1 Tax=Fluviicola sp. TaxID=1917219 RepID=UPI00260297F0|nr:winged helix-turn-helix domain-containing protein [Fluviicola sp.]MDF3026546.1 DNA-binding response regulator RprY [Fluviicola sp.]